MFRGAAIGLAISMLLTTVATLLMLTGTASAQQGPQHVFSGYVSNHRQPLNEGFVRVFIGQAHEVASGDIRQGRYKLAVVQPAGDYFSGRTLRFVVVYQGREYERPGQIGWQAGRTNEENFDIEGWQWHQGQPQRIGGQPRQDDQEARLEMERERMEMEAEMRREEQESRREMERERMEGEADQRERETEMREKEGEERREMERERMESEEEMRREEMERQREMDEQRMEQEREREEQRMEMERERMERQDEMRREEMEQRREMEQQLMERGQPGVQAAAGERPKSGPSRGLFSNKKSGEASSGIDNIMDPTTLTIIGIVLTVLTTGMTLFRGN